MLIVSKLFLIDDTFLLEYFFLSFTPYGKKKKKKYVFSQMTKIKDKMSVERYTNHPLHRTSSSIV